MGVPGVSREVEEGPPIVSGAKERYASNSLLMLAAAKISVTEGRSLAPAGGVGGLIVPPTLPDMATDLCTDTNFTIHSSHHKILGKTNQALLQFGDLQRRQDRQNCRRLPAAECSSLPGCLHNCMQYCSGSRLGENLC